jgi:hypothetical protein
MFFKKLKKVMLKISAKSEQLSPLGLKGLKKSARCVNKWFSLEMKKEQFRTYQVAEAMAAAIL